MSLHSLQSYSDGSFDDCFNDPLGVYLPRQASRCARYCAMQATGGQATAARLGVAAASGFDYVGRTSGGCVGDGRPSRCRAATASGSQLRRGRSGGTCDPLQQCRGAPTVAVDAGASAKPVSLCRLRFALAGASRAAAAWIDTGFVSKHLRGRGGQPTGVVTCADGREGGLAGRSLLLRSPRRGARQQPYRTLHQEDAAGSATASESHHQAPVSVPRPRQGRPQAECDPQQRRADAAAAQAKAGHGAGPRRPCGASASDAGHGTQADPSS